MIAVNAAIAAPKAPYILSRDYTCTRCGETTNGIPYGPLREEWCATCWFAPQPMKSAGGTKAAAIQALIEKHDAEDFNFPITTVADALQAITRKIRALEDEAEDLRDEAWDAERKAGALDALKKEIEALR